MNAHNSKFSAWVGRSESRTSDLTSHPMAAMAATLDRPSTIFNLGDKIPPLWHWLYFLETTTQSQLAEDGHAKKGEFLPPIDLPRRMWAGSRIDFLQPLHVGEQASRLSTIKSIEIKQGRSGELGFVTVEHIISGPNGIALREEHDIVYREAAIPQAASFPAQAASVDADFRKVVYADPVLLFRYSALTFNSHRIHYDREFTTSKEGYPGLVVHGPLLATLMLELLICSIPGNTVQQFQFRAIRPIFDHIPFTVCCNKPDHTGRATLWISDQSGALCMQGSALVMEK